MERREILGIIGLCLLSRSLKLVHDNADPLFKVRTHALYVANPENDLFIFIIGKKRYPRPLASSVPRLGLFVQTPPGGSRA